MRHTKKEVIARVIREFQALDRLVARLSAEEWKRPLPRPESKDPWTVKDALAHITHWKADAARSVRREPKPAEERGLNITAGNRLVFRRWHKRRAKEVLAWHRRVQRDVLRALEDVPEEYFSGKDRKPDWPGDLDGHSAYHRIQDIELALKKK